MVATLWAAVISWLPVVAVMSLAQFGADARSLGTAARLGLAGWLLGHGVPVRTSAGLLALAPLTIGVLAAWRLARAGVHVSRAIGARDRGSPRQALVVALAVGAGYGLLGLIAALVVGTGRPGVSPGRAAATLAVFGALAALCGSLRSTGALGSLTRRVPGVLLDGARAGGVAALLLLGAGAAAVGLAVATGGGEASDMIGAYRTGVAGQAGITLISLGFAPNAAIWAAAYLLGPGFAVGTDTVVRTTEVTVGALPAVPLMAGLPHGPVDGFGALLFSVPLVAGMTAGWLLTRSLLRRAGRDRSTVGWSRLLSGAAVAGPVAGVLLGLAAAVSGGSLGGGRLAEIGPVSWQVAAMATLMVTVGALVGVAAARAVPAG
ncbi:MAG TPA: DUF6350 family protein [Micromonospora sp.]